MIVVTLDLEWSPDPVLEDVFSLLADYDISATLFSTHDDGFDLPHHDRSLHPNFLKDRSEEDILSELDNIHPNARGIRSHSLYVHSKLRNLYGNFGIEYESNYMMHKVDGIQPFRMPSGTVQFPIYFMDDDWFTNRGRSDGLPDFSELLGGDGLKVFDFHPPHIVFNTPDERFYKENREDYWEESPDIDEIRYQGVGVRDLFVGLLDYISRENIQTATLRELYKERYESCKQ